MGSPFYYSMQVSYTKKETTDGKVHNKRGQGNVKIYGIKPGTLEESGWPRITTGNVDNFKLIVDGADGARSFTVCVDAMAARDLADREVDGFILSIFDTRVKGFDKMPTIVAQIFSKDMVASKLIPMERGDVAMTVESLPMQVFAINLDFHGSDDGPTFSRTR